MDQASLQENITRTYFTEEWVCHVFFHVYLIILTMFCTASIMIYYYLEQL